MGMQKSAQNNTRAVQNTLSQNMASQGRSTPIGETVQKAEPRLYGYAAYEATANAASVAGRASSSVMTQESRATYLNFESEQSSVLVKKA